MDACACAGSSGSNNIGNASSATRLPALLAAYNQYGSDVPRFAAANQRWSNGAVDASTTNGRPTVVATMVRSQVIGFCVARTAPTCVISIGSNSSGSQTMTL